MRVDRFSERKCLNCDQKLDAATAAPNNDSAPEPGNVSLCVACSHIMIFTEDMGLRNPTVEELESIVKDENVVRCRGVVETRDTDTGINESTKEQVSFGVVVNLAAKTVEGFGELLKVPR